MGSMSGLQEALKKPTIKRTYLAKASAMTPEKQALLKTHLDAIAKILYEESLASPLLSGFSAQVSDLLASN